MGDFAQLGDDRAELVAGGYSYGGSGSSGLTPRERLRDERVARREASRSRSGATRLERRAATLERRRGDILRRRRGL